MLASNSFFWRQKLFQTPFLRNTDEGDEPVKKMAMKIGANDFCYPYTLHNSPLSSSPPIHTTGNIWDSVFDLQEAILLNPYHQLHLYTQSSILFHSLQAIKSLYNHYIIKLLYILIKCLVKTQKKMLQLR